MFFSTADSNFLIKVLYVHCATWDSKNTTAILLTVLTFYLDSINKKIKIEIIIMINDQSWETKLLLFM